ncbi:MAG: hypothetical protein AAFR77_19230 [Cyanobacteria bacterium J06631_2]
MPRNFFRKLRPEVEDFFISEAVPFHYPITELGFDLVGHQMSVYSEAWDAQIIRSKRHGIIIANNTYLSSFAYNIAAVWVQYGHEYESLKNEQDCLLSSLLAYNLKKFFAEQIMRRHDCVFGNGIFLETLLYEEHLMIPVLEAGQENPETEELYRDLQGLMSSLLLFHELGHVVRDNRRDLLGLMREDTAIQVLGNYWNEYPEMQRIEFECDTFAVLLMLEQLESSELANRLREIVFAFTIFAVMICLDRSADATAAQIKANSESENLDNFFDSMEGASFVIGIDNFAKARAESVQLIAETIAAKNGIELFAASDKLSISRDILNVLLQFTLDFINSCNPPYRGKCEMLGRALQGNTKGMRYLRLRSKKFNMPNTKNQN